MDAYMLRRQTDKKKSFWPLMATTAALLLFLLLSGKALAANTGAVTVSSSNNSLGAVFCTKNGASFEHYVYVQPGDYITLNALPVNKNYNFINWTNNGVIVSESSTYSFTAKDESYVIVAHFDSKSETKHKRYDADKDISSITHNTSACTFASGYKIDGMTINTALMPLDEATTSTVEAMTSGTFLGAFRIQFTFGYEGKEKQTLDHTTRLVLKLPAYRAGTCRIVALSESSPVLLDDLDSDEKTVTFDVKKSGLYAVTCADLGAASGALPGGTGTVPTPTTPIIPTGPAVPAAPMTPVVPADNPQPAPAVPVAPAIDSQPAPAAPPVTEEQYKDAVIQILRYQLQQQGITPAA